MTDVLKQVLAGQLDVPAAAVVADAPGAKMLSIATYCAVLAADIEWAKGRLREEEARLVELCEPSDVIDLPDGRRILIVGETQVDIADPGGLYQCLGPELFEDLVETGTTLKPKGLGLALMAIDADSPLYEQLRKVLSVRTGTVVQYLEAENAQDGTENPQ